MAGTSPAMTSPIQAVYILAPVGYFVPSRFNFSIALPLAAIIVPNSAPLAIPRHAEIRA
jgi:hypothetical protein